MSIFDLVLINGLLNCISVGGFLIVIAMLIQGVALFFCSLEKFVDHNDDPMDKIFTKHIKWHLIPVLLLFVFAPIPSKDDLIGIYVISHITEIDGINELPENIVSLINKYAEERLLDE